MNAIRRSLGSFWFFVTTAVPTFQLSFSLNLKGRFTLFCLRTVLAILPSVMTHFGAAIWNPKSLVDTTNEEKRDNQEI